MASATQILVVEDDQNIVALLEAYLTSNGFEAVIATTGDQGLKLALGANFDVLVLDVMLPGCDGFQIAREVRAVGNQTPILFLTARSVEADILDGFSAGADDYLTKPFSPRELIARLKALIARRRISRPVLQEMRNARLVIDNSARTCQLDGYGIDLTAHEFRILSALSASPNRVFDRDQLTTVLYPGGEAIGPKAIDVHVHNLRRKLGVEGSDIIQTVRGFGYRYCKPGDKPS